jgi:hypothetical protein
MYLANWAYIQCQYVIHKINVFKQFFLVFYYYSQSGNDPQENSQIWLQDKYENKILKHFKNIFNYIFNHVWQFRVYLG